MTPVSGFARHAYIADTPAIVRLQTELMTLHGVEPTCHLGPAIMVSILHGEYWVCGGAPGEAITGCARCVVVRSDWTDRSRALVDSVYVLPEYRQQGVAARLLQRIQEEDSTLDELYMFVHKANTGALAAWRKLGFSESPDYVYLEKVAPYPARRPAKTTHPQTHKDKL